MKHLLLFIPLFANAQCEVCEQATTLTELPYSDTFCTENDATLCQVEGECFDCFSNAHWYEINIAEGGGVLTMEVGFDLCTFTGANCGNVNGYYYLYDSCDGNLLSMPREDCWGYVVLTSCWWPWYVYNEITCFAGPPETASGLFNYPPSDHYMVEFELSEGTYYLAIAPSGTCNQTSYGCVEVEFSGPNILEIVQESEPFTESEQDQNMNGVYYTEGIGVYILKDGKKYNLLGEEI